MKFKIYVLRDPTTNEIRYCGKSEHSLKGRLDNHIRESRKHQSSHKHHWINNVLNSGFEPTIELLDELDEEESGITWQEAEIFYIRRLKELGYRLTNATNGGDGADWTNPKYREKMIAKFNTPETKKKKSISAKKAAQDPETQKKVAALRNDPVHQKKAADGRMKAWESPERHKQHTDNMIKRHQDPDYSKHMAEIHADPEYRKRLSESITEANADPEYRQNMSITITEKWQDPEYQKKMEGRNEKRFEDPNERKKISDSVKQLHIDNPEYRQKAKETLMKSHTDPVLKQRRAVSRAKTINSPEYKKKMADKKILRESKRIQQINSELFKI